MERICFQKPNTPRMKIFMIDDKIISRVKPAAAQRGDGVCPPSHCPLWASCSCSICAPIGSEPGDCPKDSTSTSTLRWFWYKKKSF